MMSLIVIPQSIPIGTAIDELELVLDVVESDELAGMVLLLPI